MWYLFALGSGVLIGLKIVLEKTAVEGEKPLDYSIAYMIISSLLGLALIPWANLLPEPQFLLYVYLASILLALGYWGWNHALRDMEVSIAAPQTALGVVFTIVIGILFLGESLGGNQILGIALLLGGSAWLSFSSKGFHAHAFSAGHGSLLPDMSDGFWRNEMILLGSLLAYAGAAALERVALGFESPQTMILFTGIFILINLSIIHFLQHGKLGEVVAVIKEEGWLLAMMGVITVVYRVLYAQALAVASLSLVYPLKRVSILVSTVVGGEIYNEENVIMDTLTALIMLGGIWLIVGG